MAKNASRTRRSKGFEGTLAGEPITVVSAIDGYHLGSRSDNLSIGFRRLLEAMAFQLVAGHPALDLVNTLDWRFRVTGAEELLKTYDDVLRFTEQSKLLAPAEIRKLRRSGGETTLLHCRELRETLADVFYGRPPSIASRKTLERYFQAARLKQKLYWAQTPRVQWKWVG